MGVEAIREGQLMPWPHTFYLTNYTCLRPVSCGFTNTTYQSFEWAETLAEMKKNFRRLLDGIAPQVLEPNPLTILSRAVNAVRLAHRIAFQPRWRSTRFKAKT